jgi:hypothetical protein
MRTTVTLDKDVERMLRGIMHRKHKSFKQALNDAVRAGTPASLNKLADDLEADAFIEQHRRS